MNYVEFYADLGALGNYPGSPFLPSDSDMLLESPDQQDIGNVKYYPGSPFLSSNFVIACSFEVQFMFDLTKPFFFLNFSG